MPSPTLANATRNSDLTDDLLGWKARAALRAGQWKVVRKAVEAMGDDARRDSTWVYWHAKAALNGKPSDAERAEARQALESIASPKGFYEQLALEELGQRVVVPPAPAPLTAEEKGRRPCQPRAQPRAVCHLAGHSRRRRAPSGTTPPTCTPLAA